MENESFQRKLGRSFLYAACAAGLAIIIIAGTTPLWVRPDGDRRNTCLSNEKQIGLGLLQYVQDNDEMLPNTAWANAPNQTWRTLLYPYIKSKQIFQCPDRPYEPDAPDGLPLSYAANDSGVFEGGTGSRGLATFAPPGAKPLALAEFDDPQYLIAVCEITGTSRYDFDAGEPTIPGSGNEQIWAGHKGKSNFLLMDGHAKSLDPPETLGYTDPAADKPGGAVPRNLWYRDQSHPASPVELANVSNVVRE